MLAVVLDLEADSEVGAQRPHERIDGTVALAHDGAGLAVDQKLGRHRGAPAAGGHLATEDAESGFVGEVVVGEHVPHLAGLDDGARPLGNGLDLLGELHLQTPREVEAVLGVHDVGHAALA